MPRWLYSLTMSVPAAKKPVPIGCPVAGMFKFDQLGEIKFRTRILHGITDSPRPDLRCQYVISEFAACHQGQKAQTEISIDNEKCYSVDYLGRPHDIYSECWDILTAATAALWLSSWRDLNSQYTYTQTGYVERYFPVYDDIYIYAVKRVEKCDLMYTYNGIHQRLTFPKISIA